MDNNIDKVKKLSPKEIDQAYLDNKREILRNQLNRKESIFGSVDNQFTATPIDYNELGYDKASKGEHKKLFWDNWHDNSLINLIPGGDAPYKIEKNPWSQFSMPDDMAYKAFKEQTVADLTYDATVGFTKNLAAGFIDNIASWNLAELSDWQAGKGLDVAGSWLDQQSQKIKDNIAKENQIYSSPDNSMWNGAYWANQVQSGGYTAGIMTEMLGEQALLALATGGLGNAAGLGKTGLTLTRLGMQGLMGLSGGIREANLNARQTGVQTYESLKRQGYSEEDSRKYAAEAAWTGFKTEAGPLMVLNTIQNIALFGGVGKFKVANAFARGETPQLTFGFSDFLEKGIEKALPNVTNKYAKLGIEMGVTGLSEGFEEGVQEAAAEWGQHTGQKDALGSTKAKIDELTSILKDKTLAPEDRAEYQRQLNQQQQIYQKSKSDGDPFSLDWTSMRDNMVGGFFGGVLMAGGAKGVNKLRGYVSNNNLDTHIQSALENAVNSTKNHFENKVVAKKELEKALLEMQQNPSEENNRNFAKAIAKFSRADRGTELDLALHSLRLDYLKGKGSTVFDTYISRLQQEYDAATKGDTKALQEMGYLDEQGNEKIPGAIEYMKTFDKKIEGANFIKEKLNDILLNKTSDFDSAYDILEPEYSKKRNVEDLTKIQSDIELLYTNDNILNKLNTRKDSSVATRYRLENELYALKRVEKEGTLSTEDSERIKEIEEELNTVKNYTVRDKQLISSNKDIREEAITAHISEIEKQNEISQNEKDIAKQSDLNTIQEKILERKKEAVAKAKTKKELDQATKEAEKTLSKKKAQEVKDAAKAKEAKVASGIDETISKEDIKVSPNDNKEKALTYEEKLKALESQQKDMQEHFSPEDIVSQEDIQKAFFGSRENALANSKLLTPVPQDILDTTNSYLESIKEANKKEPTFRDFIRDLIQNLGKDKIEQSFNKHRRVFEATGRKFDEDPMAVYDSFFYDLKKDYFDKVETLEEETVHSETQKSIKQANKNTSKLAVYNPNTGTTKQVGTLDEDGRTLNDALKFAFNFTDFERIDETTWKRLSRNLKSFQKNDVVKNHFVLDKEFLRHIQEEQKKSNVLKIRRLDIEELPFGKNSDTGKEETWGEVKKRQQGTLSDEAFEKTEWYKNNVPMGIAYEGDYATDGPVYLAMVHNLTWYDTKNISEVEGKEIQEDVSNKGKANVSKLRSKVLETDNIEGFPIKINDGVINFGTADKLKNEVPVTINEATGDTHLLIVKRNQDGTISFNHGTDKFEGFISNRKSIEDKINSNPGSNLIVHVNEVGLDEKGNKVYQAFFTLNDNPTLKEGSNLKNTLNTQAVNNARAAMFAAIILNNQENQVLIDSFAQLYNINPNSVVSLAKTIKDKISEDLGIDITRDLRGYLRNFVNTKSKANENLSGYDHQENVNNTGKEGLTSFFGHSFNNSIEVAEKQSPEIARARTERKIAMQRDKSLRMSKELRGSFQIGGKIVDNTGTGLSNEQLVADTLNDFNKLFGENGIFKNSIQNYNSETLSRNKSNITNFGEDFKPTNTTTYDSFLKDNFKTIVLSHEIETIKGEKKWITDIQPMIYFGYEGMNEAVAPTKTLQERINTAVEETKKELAQEEVETKIKSFDAIEAQMRANNISENLIQIAKARFEQSIQNSTFNSRLDEFSAEELAGQETNKISGITNQEQNELVDSLKHNIIINLDFKSKESNIKEQILKGIQSSISDVIEPLLENNKQLLEVLNKIPNTEDMIAQTNLAINKLESIIKEQSKIINLDSSEAQLGMLTNEFNKLLNTDFEEVFDNIQEENEQEENYSKQSAEKDLKLSFSTKLRLSLFGIEEKNKGGQNKLSFLGTKKYISADDIYNKILDITTTIPSSWDALIANIEVKEKDSKNVLYSEIKNRLQSLPKEVKNQLLFKMISKRFEPYSIKNNPNKEGMNVTSSNIMLLKESLSSDNILKNSIIRRFANSDFGIPEVFTDKDGITETKMVLNKVYTSNILKELNELKEYLNKQFEQGKVLQLNTDKVITGVNKEVIHKIKEVFNKINLEDISENTIEYLLKMEKETFFSNKTGSILNQITVGLATLLNKSGSVIISQKENNIFNNMSSALNPLVETETMLNGNSVNSSVRVGDKTLQGAVANTSLYVLNQAIVNSDKNDPNSLINKLLSIPQFANNTTLLTLLGSEKFKKLFSEIGFSSPETYKYENRKTFGDGNIDKISLKDILATKLGIYTNRNFLTELEEEVVKNLDKKTGLTFAIKQMASHTLSDKGRIAFLTNILLDFKGSEVTVNSDGTIDLHNEIREYLLQQVFDSELERIKLAYSNPSDISDHKVANKVFHYLPSLNSISVSARGIDINFIAYLQNRLSQGLDIEENILSQAREQAGQKISEYVNTRVDKKISKDGNSGELVEAGMFDNSEERKKAGLKPFVNIDSTFVKRKSTASMSDVNNMRFIMTEYVINNLLHNISTHAMYLGDLSFYAKSKLIPTIKDQKDALGNPIIDTDLLSTPSFYSNMSHEIGYNLDKRTASLIAPGLLLADSQNPNSIYPQEFIHLAVQDVEKASDFIKDIEEYQKITATDAQEYTTWKTHLDILLRQGSRITEEQYNSLFKKLSNPNLELTEEDKAIIFQPIKPVYTHLIYDERLGTMRPVYMKSSSFPLLPQLTKNLKLDEVRKKMEALENVTPDGRFTPVRMSYQTANKIGSRSTQLTMDMLYSEEALTDEVLKSAMSVLPMEGYKIQQENPSKEEKHFHKGHDSHKTMGSQFMKTIMGNFINHNTNEIFPNLFDESLLNEIGIDMKDRENLTGQELDKIYSHVYFKYSDILRAELENELGLSDIPFERLSIEDRNNRIKKLQEIIRREVVSRGYPDYLSRSIELIKEKGDELEMSMPIFFDTNTHKFEALLQSIIATRLIKHMLPGNEHILGSPEGFTKKTTLDTLSNIDKQGIVWVGEMPEGDLKPTRIETVDGKKVTRGAQVLVKSHFKYTDSEGKYKYVDLRSPEYSEEIKDKNGNIVGLKLKTDKIDPQLLSSFSFRIPTSSHQSGMLIEIAGFLPDSMQDLLIVPKESLTQMGEDFDVDKRHVYKNNYTVDKEGNIKELKYDTNLKEFIKQLNEATSDNDSALDNLLADIFDTDILDDNENMKAELKSIGVKEDKQGKLVFSKKVLNALHIKMLENSLINIYKSVYSTTDQGIQDMFIKPLVTDVAEDTAKLMDSYLQSSNIDSNFSIMDDSFQTNLIKVGADGKGGIGVHSNAVTFEAQMQRLQDNEKVHLGFFLDETEDKPAMFKPFEFLLTGQHSDGILGAHKETIDGKRNISDVHAENQNVSTDNINKQIMAKRNENTYTMGVYALLAHMGIDTTDLYNITLKDGRIITFNTKAELDNYIKSNKESIKKVPKDFKISLTSLFLNQPVLRDYCEMMEKYNSVSAEYISIADKEAKIYKDLSIKYGFSSIEKDDVNVDSVLYNTTSNELFTNLIGDTAKNNPTLQLATLLKFLDLSKESKSVSRIQQLFNISTSKLGISYFETLQRIQTLNEVASESLAQERAFKKGDIETMNNFSHLIGEVSINPIDGYEKIGDYYWKPTTIEGKMLLNSIAVDDKLMPTFFPYNSPHIKGLLENIFSILGKDYAEKSKANLALKYSIMSSFKDFIASNIGVSKGNLTQERQRLFFDNEKIGNQALGSILMDLKTKGNPIMANALLKDLEVNKNKINGLVTILHTTNDNSTLERATKYDAFLDLLKDNTKLGIYNGEMLTVSKLAQDLVTYSFLTDNQNGATGFKNFVNIEYLNVIGVNRNYRNIYKALSSSESNIQLKDIIARFERQYFQHNPDITKRVSKKGLKTLEDNYTKKGEIPPKYVSINSTDKTSNKNLDLYQFNETDSKYQRIPVLGTTAYNEYDSTKDKQPSLINKGGLQEGYIKGRRYIIPEGWSEEKKIYFDQFQSMLEGKNWDTVEKIMNNLINSGTTSEEYKEFARNLLPFINKDVRVEWKKGNKNQLEINKEGELIVHLDSNIMEYLMDKYDDFSLAQQKMREIIFEEIIHSITVKELNQHLKMSNSENGDFKLKDDAPLYMQKIAKAYELAREAVPYNPNDTSTYYSKNIQEFVAGMFIAEDYRQNLEDSNTGFVKKFLDAIRDMLKYLHTKLTGEQLTYKDTIYNAVYELLDNNKNKFGNKGIEVKETKQETQQSKKIESNKKGFKLSIDKKGKDQGKANYANAFVSYPNINTSSYQYMQDAKKQGILINDEIKADENTIAFISVNGNNKATNKQLENTYLIAREIIEAGGTVIMDSTEDANRSWNKSGEAVVQEQLGEPTGQTKEGYNYWGKNPETQSTVQTTQQLEQIKEDNPVEVLKAVEIKRPLDENIEDKINKIKEQEKLELKKAEEDWAANVDERGYPKESLQPIEEAIKNKYSKLIVELKEQIKQPTLEDLMNSGKLTSGNKNYDSKENKTEKDFKYYDYLRQIDKYRDKKGDLKSFPKVVENDILDRDLLGGLLGEVAPNRIVQSKKGIQEVVDFLKELNKQLKDFEINNTIEYLEDIKNIFTQVDNLELEKGVAIDEKASFKEKLNNINENLEKLNKNSKYIIGILDSGSKVTDIVNNIYTSIGSKYGLQGSFDYKDNRERFIKLDQTKELPNSYDSRENTPIKEGVSNIFDENPELAKIGTQQQYSQYLDTIFPDSKVKDIVYHGSDTKFEGFLEDNLNYFGTKEIAKGYGKNLYPVLIDINKPYYEDGGNLSNQSYEDLFDKLDESNSDGFVSNNKKLFVPKTEEQIHILGSKQDLEGFKGYIKEKNSIFAEDIFEKC